MCASSLFRRLKGHRAHCPYIGRFRGNNHGQRDSLKGGLRCAGVGWHDPIPVRVAAS